MTGTPYEDMEPYEDMDDVYGENDLDDTMEDTEDNGQEQQAEDEYEPEELEDEADLEDEAEPMDEKTVAEEEGYPPIQESGDAFDDGLPEVTYYQVEGQKGGYMIFKQTSFMYLLPLFYMLPREFVAQRPAYLELPRNVRKLVKEKKYIDMVVKNFTFFELVSDSYAWWVWQLLRVPDKKGGNKPIPGTWDHYSGYFPIWKLCYYITSAFKYEFQKLFGWGLQFMFRAPLDDEAPWVPYERFSAMMSVMTNHVILKYNLQPTIDCAWEQRQPEDYNGKNVYFRDYQRSWYHNRTKAHVSMDELMKDHAKNGADANGNARFDIPDPKAEFEQEVVEKAAIDQFKAGLSETDMQILKMRQMRFTLEEIAEAVGYKTASAVKKRIDRIAAQYERFSKEEAV